MQNWAGCCVLQGRRSSSSPTVSVRDHRRRRLERVTCAHWDADRVCSAYATHREGEKTHTLQAVRALSVTPPLQQRSDRGPAALPCLPTHGSTALWRMSCAESLPAAIGAWPVDNRGVLSRRTRQQVGATSVGVPSPTPPPPAAGGRAWSSLFGLTRRWPHP